MSSHNSPVCFLPLDIPPMPHPEEVTNKFLASKNREDYVWWSMELLLGERRFDIPLGSRSWSWSTAAQENYPKLIKWIEDFFPFKQLYYVHLAHATHPVLPHVDENYVESPFDHHMTITREFQSHLKKNEPVGYRFIVSGDRNSLYLCRNYDPQYRRVTPQSRTWCHIPDSTDSFLIRNSRIPHGVENSGEQDKNRLMGFLLGEVDPEKHKNLIQRSLSRFRKFSLTELDIK